MTLVQWIKRNGGQAATAKLLGVSKSTVCRWVKGERVPGRTIAAKINTESRGGVSYAEIWKGRK